MSDISINNKRIAKNTVMLYFRMIIVMIVGLFTSRILLQALGVEDYGIYNVVGGFVAMFSMISSSFTSAISRFITFELGKGDVEQLKRVFSTSIMVQVGLCLIVVIVAETFGLWFLYEKMVIPDGRLNAAFWVFQLSVLSFVISLQTIPYTSSIISHERMSAFAYISIYEVVCKLIICFVVLSASIDKLVLLSILMCCISISSQIVYIWYCKKHFEECSYHFTFDKVLLKKMFGFAGWNFVGSSGWVLRAQGGTILFNLFGGPAANAANGIASALSSAVTGFVSNFTTAFNPQITKNYAAKKYVELNRLLIYCSKISFFMLLFIGLPVMLNTHFILSLWLGYVPEHSAELVRLIILFSLSETISTSLITAKLATGNIRNYQLIVGGVQLLSVPLAYIVLKLGAPIESIYVSYFVVSVGCLISRMLLLRGDIPLLSIRKFFIKVVLNVWLVGLIASVIPVYIAMQMDEGWSCLIATGLASVVSCTITMFYFGFDKTARNKIIELVKSKLRMGHGKG